MEANALEIQRQGGLDFTSDQEKKYINEVFNNAMECLNEEDRALPQVTNGTFSTKNQFDIIIIYL